MSPVGARQNFEQEFACHFAAEGAQKKCQLWPVAGSGRLRAAFQLAQGDWRLGPILLDAKK